MAVNPPRVPVAGVSGSTLLRNSLLFTRALRASGVPTDVAGAIDFARALTIVDIGDRTEVHAAGAAIFVRRRDDLPVYDEVFRAFWRRHELRIPPAPIEEGVPRPPSEKDRDNAAVESRPEAPDRERKGALGRAEPGTEEASAEEGEAEAVSPRAWSAAEAFRHREFERMTPAELREAERLIDLVRPRLERRRTRRSELHRHGTVLAPRAMLRRNLKSGGDLVDWVWRRPARRPRPIVLICDVSGSMERHSRLLLRFVHAIFRSPDVRAEAFVFGTHLTRVTRELRAKEPDRALARVSASVTDWSGGTRIGDSLRTFNLRWARRVLTTSGVVVVLSDGWDRGDPGPRPDGGRETPAELPPPRVDRPARRQVRVPAARGRHGRGVPVDRRARRRRRPREPRTPRRDPRRAAGGPGGPARAARPPARPRRRPGTRRPPRPDVVRARGAPGAAWRDGAATRSRRRTSGRAAGDRMTGTDRGTAAPGRFAT